MSNFFKRIGTKIGGAVGNVQRTSLDAKIRDGVQHYSQSKEQTQKMVDDVKAMLPNVSGLTKSEKLGQTLAQTSQVYGADPSAQAFKALASVMQQIGKEERVMDKAIKESCIPPLQTFYGPTCAAFKKEKDLLDNKCLDMDGAKGRNQKTPNEANQQSETDATNAFNAQKTVVEAIIDDLPNQRDLQRAALKAFAQALLELYTKQVELLNGAVNAMG